VVVKGVVGAIINNWRAQSPKEISLKFIDSRVRTQFAMSMGTTPRRIANVRFDLTQRRYGEALR